MVDSNLTRRNFIGAAAAGTVAANAAQQNIHWGLGIVTWVARANRAKKPLDWPEILDDIQAGGFEAIEVFTQNTLPVTDENMDRLARVLPNYKVKLCSIYWADQFHVPEQHERIRKECHRFLGYLKRFQADRLTIGPPGPNVEDEAAAISNMAKIMNYVGRVAAEEYGMKTGVHNHVGGLIENPRQIDQLMEETDPRYFNFSPDVAQIWMGGGHPVRMMEKYKNRLVYIHYKDIRAYNRSLRGYMDNVIELGRGVIDFPAMHRILKGIGYKGWITIDLDNARISPLQSAKDQREYIDRVLAPIYA